MPKLLEIACFNLESCAIAQNAGAHRIEFCSDYNSGGITPTHPDILEARKLIHIPLYIMIRPRKGNFTYSQEEINIMKDDILFCKQNKIDGIVFGALNNYNAIDESICVELLKLAKPMKCTFHRAFDYCSDINKNIEKLIELEFDTVLSSGGSSDAESGIEMLKQLQINYGSKICIMPGGGIRPENIKYLMKETGCDAFHSSAINLNSKYIDANMIAEMLLAIKS